VLKVLWHLLRRPIDSAFCWFRDRLIEASTRVLSPLLSTKQIWYERALLVEYRDMARIANRRRDIDCWFVLNPFSTRCAHLLQRPIVSMAADFVLSSCPTGFSSDVIAGARANFLLLDRYIYRYVTLSDHVTERHLRDTLGVGLSRVTRIHHGAVSVSGHLPMPRFLVKDSESVSSAASRIRAYLATRAAGSIGSALEKDFTNNFLKDYRFEESAYILISTQNRTYKNTFRCIKAVEVLIHKCGVNVKLIMTGDLQPYMVDFIRSHGLHFDVFALPRVPNDIHACLYHCATVAAHLSFFEGGAGAFPFDEAISVGTPVVLSRNSATLEYSNREDFRAHLADPYSVNDIALKLREAIEDPRKLFEIQSEIYKEKSLRSWQAVSQEYLNVFREAAGSKANL
jgi:glycosyltransferase involved in cell wall biosynthesis